MTFDLGGNPFFVCDTCFRGCHCKMAPTYWWIQLCPVSFWNFKVRQISKSSFCPLSKEVCLSINNGTSNGLIKDGYWQCSLANSSLFVFDWMLIKSYCFWETKLSKNPRKNIRCPKKTTNIKTKWVVYPVYIWNSNQPKVSNDLCVQNVPNVLDVQNTPNVSDDPRSLKITPRVSCFMNGSKNNFTESA